MRKLILWLAKVFKVDFPTVTVEKIVEKIVEKEVPVVEYVYDGDSVDSSLLVKGDLIIRGKCEVKGDLITFKQ